MSDPSVIRLILTVADMLPTSPPRFLCEFDPEAANGIGLIVSTDDPERAIQYPSSGAAFEAWRTQSATVPTRDDGKPNRPLTAFTVEIITLTQARSMAMGPEQGRA